MATIHPSRMALVPQDPKDSYPRRRSPSPRRRSPSPPRRDRDDARKAGNRDCIKSRDDDKARDRHRHREDERDRHRDGGRDKRGEKEREDVARRPERAHADDFFDEGDRSVNGSRKRSRSGEPERGRDDRREPDRPRRPSPEYSEYRRPSPARDHEDSAPVSAPWRQQENMYPAGRRDRAAPGGYGGGADFLDSRRQQRESTSVNVWPSSPKAPSRELRSPSPSSKRRKKSSKRRHDSDDSSTDSEEERRRRERKERKKARKEKDRDREYEKERDRDRRHRKSESRRYSDDEDEDRHRHRRSRSRSKPEDKRRSATRTKSPEQKAPSNRSDAEDDEWVEKPGAPPLAVSPPVKNTGSASMPPPPVPIRVSGAADDDSDEEVGPQPLHQITSSRGKTDERQYGGALLRGEGSAMAAFLKDGTDMRIPRRGEIGLSSDEIAQYEDVGYVMSGSRHRRMNAVRMRKENQVISAEEKRGILKLQQEERERREAILREEFQQLVDEKLKTGATK